ncbi:hypothetical protein B0H66DRAFT_68624 [Apodospora peruviana]|uniref:DNA2/NAM7 helicase-like C-terminal domain-containing protein n=1 Tax=Apodospora peruviana TaxID=516989 RepID=A0AAE0MGY9_9PEZI|nr:hypothetical protein B0H66DRAFT_68624 [Apodospora peruviana]
MMNHRALSGLHKLSSELFYDGRMGVPESLEENCPESLKYLREYFMKFQANGPQPETTKSFVPRFLVDYNYFFEVEELFKSFWNSTYYNWVMARILELLDDPSFTQIDGLQPGTILILSLFREAFEKYRQAVGKDVAEEDRARVEVRTLGTVAGAEADVVFVDMVMYTASPHTNDPKRLCVALTRARQAEVIMMSSGMGRRSETEDFSPTNLAAIYNGCESGEHGTLVVMPQEPKKKKQEPQNKERRKTFGKNITDQPEVVKTSTDQEAND